MPCTFSSFISSLKSILYLFFYCLPTFVLIHLLITNRELSLPLLLHVVDLLLRMYSGGKRKILMMFIKRYEEERVVISSYCLRERVIHQSQFSCQLMSILKRLCNMFCLFTYIIIGATKRRTTVSSNGDNNDSYNQSVKGKSFSENEHKNHSDKDLLLLTTSANTSISSNANRETSS